MKLSVIIFLSGRGINRGSAWRIVMFSSIGFGAKSRSKEERSFAGSHELSNERSWATSATVSLTELKIVGAGDDPKGRRPRRYARSFKMVMHVVADCMFACIRLYAASMSVLFIHIF